jgi:hypothetical protein
VRGGTSMWRYFLFLLATILFSTLNSCAKPVGTETDGVSRHKVFLKDIGNGVCQQLPIGLMWQIEKSKMIFNWQEADESANQLKLDGFDDWRLPTRDEYLTLYKLLLMKKGDCSIKIRKGHWVTENKKVRSGFWDDEPLCGGPEFRWIKTKEGSVRAVRP